MKLDSKVKSKIKHLDTEAIDAYMTLMEESSTDEDVPASCRGIDSDLHAALLAAIGPHPDESTILQKIIAKCGNTRPKKFSGLLALRTIDAYYSQTEKEQKTKTFTEIENIQVKDASVENVDAFITNFFHILSYVTMEDEQILVKLKQKLQKGALKDHTRLQACISTHEQGKDKKSPYKLRDAVQELCATLRAESEGKLTKAPDSRTVMVATGSDKSEPQIWYQNGVWLTTWSEDNGPMPKGAWKIGSAWVYETSPPSKKGTKGAQTPTSWNNTGKESKGKWNDANNGKAQPWGKQGTGKQPKWGKPWWSNDDGSGKQQTWGKPWWPNDDGKSKGWQGKGYFAANDWQQTWQGAPQEFQSWPMTWPPQVGPLGPALNTIQTTPTMSAPVNLDDWRFSSTPAIPPTTAPVRPEAQQRLQHL